MNMGSSNANVLTEENDVNIKREIMHTNYAHKRNIMKQRACGLMLIAAALFAVIFADDMELVLGLIPVGIYLMVSKKTILTFESE